MQVKWLGHSFFLVRSATGVQMAFDPFGETVGYPLQTVQADFVFVSHDHFDHNNLKLVRGYEEVFREVGQYEKKGIKIAIFSTSHDEEGGKKRGKNHVVRVEADGMVLVHCGDLGMIPEPQDLETWKPVDILLLPVGGVYTIDAQQAQSLVRALKPRIAVPMHYKTRYLQFALGEVNPFLEGFEAVRYIRGSSFEVYKEKLPPATEIWVLEV